MKINAQTGNFEITADEMNHIRMRLKSALRSVRHACDLPLDSYKQEGALENSDFAQSAILDIGKALGIEFPGAHFGHEIDLRKGDE